MGSSTTHCEDWWIWITRSQQGSHCHHRQEWTLQYDVLWSFPHHQLSYHSASGTVLYIFQQGWSIRIWVYLYSSNCYQTAASLTNLFHMLGFGGEKFELFAFIFVALWNNFLCIWIRNPYIHSIPTLHHKINISGASYLLMLCSKCLNQWLSSACYWKYICSGWQKNC